MDDYNHNIISDIYKKAIDLHDGNEHAADSWLRSPREEFNGRSAYDSFKPYDGCVEVENLLDKELQQKQGAQKF